MPTFHFHLRNPDVLHADEVGLDCPDLELAYLEACCAIPGVAAKLLGRAEDPLEYAFEITDAEGSPLLEVPFRATLRDTRRLTKMGVRAARVRVRANGAESTTVQSLIEQVREQVRTSREWVRQARARAEHLFDNR